MKTIVGMVLLHLLVFDTNIADAGKFPPFDYCIRNCNNGTERNALCISNCTNKEGLKDLPPDKEFRKNMVDAHNKYRQEVAEGKNTKGTANAAANMRAISYDMNLECTCACWLYKAGEATHDTCRGGRSFATMGQNMYLGEKLKPEDVVAVWYEEIKDLTKTEIDSYPDTVAAAQKIAHVAQLLWGETTHIGCARAQIGGKNLVGCNYGPAGNVSKKPVYTIGALACGSLTANNQYKNLCGESTLPPEAETTGNEELVVLRALYDNPTDQSVAWGTGVVHLIAMSGIVMLLIQTG